MARASTIQHSFDGGELSELLLGRQDLDVYAKGLFTCLNSMPFTQGPWTRRPGTVFLHQVQDNAKKTRVIPFQYSTTQTYILEFGEFYIRFYTNHGLLTNASQSITSISGANPAVVTKIAHGYSNGDRLQLTGQVISGTGGYASLLNREVMVNNKTADTFELVDSDGFNISTLGGGVISSYGNMAKIFSIGTSYTQAELVDIRVVQSADTLYIVHPNHPPASLVRVSALSWTLANLTFTDGPYDVLNPTATAASPTTLTPSAATGAGVTLTASAVTGINNNQGFLATDVGRLIRIQEGSVWGYVLVTAFSNTLVITVTVLATLTNTNAKKNWRMGIWSDTTGYPHCTIFYEDRLYFAGSTIYPQRFDGSNVSQYTNFSPSATDGTVSDSNAVSGTLNSDDVNVIRWLVGHENGLLAGTARSEWWIRGSTVLGEAITPANMTFKQTTKRGSDPVAAVAANRAAIFVQRGGKKLREMAFVTTGYEYGFKTPDVTQLSEHITAPGISQLAYQEQPIPIVWAVRTDGALLGMTYDRDTGIVAWHRHFIGGSSSADGTVNAIVESIAVVSAPDGTRDELYMVVNRYVNGRTRRYIEYMSKFWETEIDTQANAFYADCGYTITDGVASNYVNGLAFLEGQTVGVLLDGAKQAPVVVTNGTITLTETGLIKTLGFWYNSDGQSMPIEAGAQDGSAQGKIKSITRIGFWLLDTLGFKFGGDFDTLEEIVEREWGDNYGSPPPLFTGVHRERLTSDYDRLGQYCWRCDGPFPGNLLATMPQTETSDDS
jgi:hypothetical protein